MQQSCAFANEVILYDYVRECGLQEFMKAKHEKYFEEAKELHVSWTCPFPFGNPFLLEYRLRANGSGTTLEEILMK